MTKYRVICPICKVERLHDDIECATCIRENMLHCAHFKTDKKIDVEFSLPDILRLDDFGMKWEKVDISAEL